MAAKKAKRSTKKAAVGAVPKSSTRKKASPSAPRKPGKTASSGPLIRAIQPVRAKGPRPLRLLWIPGIGADRVMFGRIIEELEPLLSVPALHSFLEYPDVMAGEVDSLESLAALIAQGILPDDPYDMVIGYSLGGMMLQILRMKGLLAAKQCVLLSTAFTGNDLNSVIHLSARLPRPPVFLRGAAQTITAAFYPVFRWGIRDAFEYGRMFARFPRTIFFEGSHWIQEWKGVPQPFYSDCLSIHGVNDPLISYRKIADVKKPDLTIEDGAHILFATHPERVAAFLAEHL